MNTDKQLTHSLDAKYYTDPQIFKLEQNGLFARTWQFAGHSSELKEPGDYFTFTIAGESLFCVKTRDNDVKAYYNVCQHRAHQLVQGKGNNCLLYTSPSPRDKRQSRMPSSA